MLMRRCLLFVVRVVFLAVMYQWSELFCIFLFCVVFGCARTRAACLGGDQREDEVLCLLYIVFYLGSLHTACIWLLYA